LHTIGIKWKNVKSTNYMPRERLELPPGTSRPYTFCAVTARGLGSTVSDSKTVEEFWIPLIDSYSAS